MPNQIGQRLVFQNAKNAITRAGLSPAGAVLSQSYLRFEVPLTTNQTTYTFDTLVNENTNPNYLTQSKLNLQDAFVVSSIGFFLCAPSSSALNANDFQLLTYPNSVILSAVGAAKAAYGVYNGNMTLTVNQRTIMTGWDLYRHYSVPQTQDASAENVIDQQNGSSDAFYPAEPNIVMVGSKKNILQVNLISALAAIQTNARLVCVFRGILAQNVTPVN
jgi:hypothetical protein